MNKRDVKKTYENEIIVVSGLPRSGTSMMMKMLEAGGIELLTDHIREADRDNPKGYYEYEKVKKIKESNAWLNQARGKAVKIISQLLYHMPPVYRYKIIFMQRHMNEILASQQKMLKSKKSQHKVDDKIMAGKFESHLEKISSWIADQPNLECLYISYNKTVKDPVSCASRVNKFLGDKLNLSAMVEAVDRSLYRNRNTVINV